VEYAIFRRYFATDLAAPATVPAAGPTCTVAEEVPTYALVVLAITLVGAASPHCSASARPGPPPGARRCWPHGYGPPPARCCEPSPGISAVRAGPRARRARPRCSGTSRHVVLSLPGVAALGAVLANLLQGAGCVAAVAGGGRTRGRSGMPPPPVLKGRAWRAPAFRCTWKV